MVHVPSGRPSASTAAGEDLAGEMTVYGTTGMTIAHFHEKKIVNGISAVLAG